MCNPAAGFTAKPGVSFFTSALGFAASLDFASSLGLLSPLAARFSPDAELSCAAAGTEENNKVRHKYMRIISPLGTRNWYASRFTAPSLDPDLPERPR